jgi:hypothetical protein
LSQPSSYDTGIIATQKTASHPFTRRMKTGSPWIAAQSFLVRSTATSRRLSCLAAHRRRPGIPSEQVAQAAAELLEIVAQPVKLNVGVPQFVARLLAGREQQNQRSDEFVVRGDVGSFLGDGASRDSRSERRSMSA